MIQRRFKPLPGESILATSPSLPGDASSSWRRRLRLFSGRALTAGALRQEQSTRAGLLSSAAQLLSPGVVDGLQLTASPDPAVILLAPGFGLTATGEPVTVPTSARIPLNALRPNPANLFGILVLEPVELRLPGESDPLQNDLGDQCEYDPATDSFLDWRLIDSALLRYVPWPTAELGPVPTVNPRNTAAWRIFALEQSDALLSYEEAGLPLALIATDNNGRLLFLDRYSVVRDGGRPRRRTTLIPSSGHPILWQSRLLQFSEHLDQLSAIPPAEAARQFSTLPPAGLLPLQFANIAFTPQTGASLRQSFFPPHISLTIRPVPLEQLDALLEPSASFAPIALDATDRVELLLPVPQPFFEPALLQPELVDPAFEASLADSLSRRAVALGYRAQVRTVLNSGERALTGKDRSFPAEDPSEAINPNPPVDPRNTPADLARLNTAAQAEIESSLLRLLKDANAAKTHTAIYLKLGLIPAAEHLEALADRGDDIINSGFLRAQADMYRLRQLLTAGTSIARLSISPALVGITEAATPTAREEAINRVLTDLKANKDPNTILKRTVRSTRAFTAADLQISIQDLDQPMFPADDQQEFFTLDNTLNFRINRGMSTPRPAPRPIEVFVEKKKEIDRGGIFTEPKRNFPTERERPPVAQPPKPATPPVVETAEPVIGRQDIRATGTFTRLNLAKGPEARDFALSTKYTIVNTLKNPIEDQSAPDLLKLATVFGGILIPGLGVKTQDWVFEKVGTTDANLRRQNALLSTLDNPAIARILDEPDDRNITDEAGHFSAAVDLVEHAIASLRGAEFFVEGLRNVANVFRKHAALLDDALNLFEARLAVIEDDLAEARQDVSLVRALLDEERQRVTLINQRRARILAEQVPFLAFRRAPSADPLRPVITRVLNPEPQAPAVPVCLSQNLTPPDELESFIDLLRESPIRWFPSIAALLSRLDRRPQFEQLMLAAQSRFASQASRIYREAEFLQVSRGRFEAPLTSLLTAQRNRTLKERQPLALTQVNIFVNLPWSEAHRVTRDIVSIGDLLEGSRPDLARLASLELDRISRVSACLVQKFAEVAPEIRLEWALRFSQFDDPVTLRALSNLPRWGEIDFLDRHDLQSFTDYLYAQINSSIPEAVETIANIVQAALLLASHAPVNRLLQGSIDEARDVEVGQAASATFDAVHLPHLRRGMLLHVMDRDTVIAHAVVDDLLDVRAQIRVTNNLTPNRILKLTIDTRVVTPQPARAEQRLTQNNLTRTEAVIALSTRRS